MTHDIDNTAEHKIQIQKEIDFYDSAVNNAVNVISGGTIINKNVKECLLKEIIVYKKKIDLLEEKLQSLKH